MGIDPCREIHAHVYNSLSPPPPVPPPGILIASYVLNRSDFFFAVLLSMRIGSVKDEKEMRWQEIVHSTIPALVFEGLVSLGWSAAGLQVLSLPSVFNT